MKKAIIAGLAGAMVLLGARCKLPENGPQNYEWKAYDKTAATSTVMTFTYPPSFVVKKGGNIGESEQIRVGNLSGRVEIYNMDFYGDENVYKDYPDRAKAMYKKGNFYVYVFYNKNDTEEKETLNNIVKSIKFK